MGDCSSVSCSGGHSGFYVSKRASRATCTSIGGIIGATLIRCDATQDEEVNAVAAYCEEKFGRIDFLVHAIAFAERDDLKGRFIATSEEGFLTAMNVSVFTLIRLTRAFEGFEGSVRWWDHSDPELPRRGPCDTQL